MKQRHQADIDDTHRLSSGGCKFTIRNMVAVGRKEYFTVATEVVTAAVNSYPLCSGSNFGNRRNFKALVFLGMNFNLVLYFGCWVFLLKEVVFDCNSASVCLSACLSVFFFFFSFFFFFFFFFCYIKIVFGWL